MSRRSLRRPTAILASLALCLPGAAALTTLVAAPAAAETTSVALVGDLQEELGCESDWAPECAATELTNDQGVWSGTFTVPAGSWNFKVALNDAWDESYGWNGNNAPLVLTAATPVTFMFDDATNRVTLSAPVPGGYDAASDEALVAEPWREPGGGNSFYFVMTDRFNNGDPTNDACIATGHAGPDGELPVDCTGTDRMVTGLDPTDKGFYHGGDIAGLHAQLPYIESLGLDAIWLTPSFVNRPVQGAGADISSGYHGYWITDFTQIDPHLGTNAELKAFIDDAHARGIKVYFDIITNHTADVIYYAGFEGQNPPYVTKAADPYVDVNGNAFDPADYAPGNQAMPLMNPDGISFPYDPELPVGMEEVKFPLWLNDPTLYHNRGFDPSWPAGEAATYMDFGDLDDLMTENQIVVDGMIEIYTAWTDLGIDGFRIDTVKHVDFQFWSEFTAAINAHTAGSNPDFYMFGEVYDADAKMLSPYVRNTGMQGVLDFAFQSSARNYVTGSPATSLAGLFRADDYYTTATSSAADLPTFLGNHDMGRIGQLVGAADALAKVELANELMFLTRGQPVVYYGDEQGIIGDGGDKDARQNMIDSQVSTYNDDLLLDGSPYGTGPGFATDGVLYSHISTLASLRASTPALATGAQIERYAEGPVFAFSRVDATEKVEHLVALNNSSSPTTVTIPTLTPGATFTGVYGTTATGTAGADGALEVTIPAHSAVVLKAGDTVAGVGDAQSIAVTAAAPEDGLVPVTAEIAPGRWAQTSFAYRVVGKSTYTPLGVAEDDTPRVFADFTHLAAGTLVEVRAVSVDADGSVVAASTLVSAGTDLASAPAEPGVIGPDSVTIPGNHNSEMGCASDWAPDCELALLAYDEASGLYIGTFDIPAGTYEYKIAVGGSWDVNYGKGGVPGGDNVTYTTADGPITFYYDPVSHNFFSTAESPVITLPGSLNTEVGCPGDWQPDCLRTLMFDGDGVGVYTWSTTALGAGTYEVKVAHGQGWAENYGQGGVPDGVNYSFTTDANKLVSFRYTLDTHLLEIAVEDPPLAGTGQFLGHWIDQTTIAWPADQITGDAAGRTWELWTDADGGLALADGDVVGGTGAPAVQLGTLTYDSAGLSAGQLENRGHLRGFANLQLQGATRADIEEALRGDLAVVQRDANGVPEVFTGLQIPGVLDDLYAAVARMDGNLGLTWDASGAPTVKLWAPTATSVDLLVYDESGAETVVPLAYDTTDGTWFKTLPANYVNRTYLFSIDVFVPTEDAIVTNTVTDPYSVGLTLNSERSVLLNLDDPAWAPAVWTDTPAPVIDQFADRTIYELHIRDFSITDESVPEELRGTYEAFSQGATGAVTDGQRVLTELADAGINTVHLLPSFDIATIQEDRALQENLTPEEWAALEATVAADPASTLPQETVMANADADGFNWGYDPFHYSTPEGSYASAANQEGGNRTLAFRTMVGGLHEMGLQVILDKVYNHTAASGQAERSVLDQVVPGYYHRLNLTGSVETSTCCQNIATEHEMAEQLMVDSVVTWARDYGVDGFRFDLMGHHSYDNMMAVREALDALTLEADGVDGASMYLYGEGWNFGEVANNARFTQATQGQLGGTGIGAFNDRLRDAVHGGGPFDSDKSAGQGYGTGLYTDPNALNDGSADELADLRHRQDLIRIGLAGNLADYSFETSAGTVQTGAQLDYNGSPAGYATEPYESVNYVDAHDNETLFDLGVWKLPADTTMDDRIAMNTLSLATVTLGQSPSFWHAGTDLLRSKSMDRNSYNSGDWFNQLDWTMQTNNFGVGLPPAADNSSQWNHMRPFLTGVAAPSPEQIAASHNQALELLQLRTTQPLLTLDSAALITEKVTFPNAGADQTAGLIVMKIDDTIGVDVDPAAAGLLVVFNSSPEPITEAIDGMAGVELALAPTLTDGTHDSAFFNAATWDAAAGAVTIPGRSVTVLVEDQAPPAPQTVENVIPPTFNEQRGVTNDTYTIPSTPGVIYLVNGAEKPAGTYPGLGTVSITATPAPGVTITDRDGLRWTHTFSMFGPFGGFYANNAWDGQHDVFFSYGNPGEVVHIGDWDGDGIDTVAIQRGNVFYVRNSLTSGPADYSFTYGNVGDVILVGDWDGDGKDTLAVRRGSWFYVRNSTSSGVADVVFSYGDPGDVILVGDWDGDGKDTLAVRRLDWFHVRNSTTTGVADVVFSYGNPGDVILVGDWDGDGKDTLGVQRSDWYYLKNSLISGVADITLNYGNPGDEVFVGDWNGDQVDTLMVRR